MSGRDPKRLRWHLHDLDPELEIPAGCARPARLARSARPPPCPRPSRPCRSSSAGSWSALPGARRRVDELEREIAELCGAGRPSCSSCPAVARSPPQSFSARSPGSSASRPAKLAMHTGSAPLPASSGKRQRHRLNRTGNRQLNCALHRIAVTQARIHAPARAYLERKQAEGKSRARPFAASSATSPTSSGVSEHSRDHDRQPRSTLLGFRVDIGATRESDRRPRPGGPEVLELGSCPIPAPARARSC